MEQSDASASGSTTRVLQSPAAHRWLDLTICGVVNSNYPPDHPDFPAERLELQQRHGQCLQRRHEHGRGIQLPDPNVPATRETLRVTAPQALRSRLPARPRSTVLVVGRTVTATRCWAMPSNTASAKPFTARRSPWLVPAAKPRRCCIGRSALPPRLNSKQLLVSIKHLMLSRSGLFPTPPAVTGQEVRRLSTLFRSHPTTPQGLHTAWRRLPRHRHLRRARRCWFQQRARLRGERRNHRYLQLHRAHHFQLKRTRAFDRVCRGDRAFGSL